MMDGVRVGNRIVGTQAPVTIGWEDIPKVEGGPFKLAFFTWFQPATLFAMLGFWYYAPNSIAKASAAIGIGIVFRLFLLGLEWVAPRHESWRLTWKEVVTDLFYVGLGYTVLRTVGDYVSSDVMAKAIQQYWHMDNFRWFTGLPLLIQAVLIALILILGNIGCTAGCTIGTHYGFHIRCIITSRS